MQSARLESFITHSGKGGPDLPDYPPWWGLSIVSIVCLFALFRFKGFKRFAWFRTTFLEAVQCRDDAFVRDRHLSSGFILPKTLPHPPHTVTCLVTGIIKNTFNLRLGGVFVSLGCVSLKLFCLSFVWGESGVVSPLARSFRCWRYLCQQYEYPIELRQF